MTRSPTRAAASPPAACWAGADEQANNDTAAVRNSALLMVGIILSPVFRLQSSVFRPRPTVLGRRLLRQFLARADLESPEPRIRGNAVHFHRIARPAIPLLHARRGEQADAVVFLVGHVMWASTPVSTASSSVRRTVPSASLIQKRPRTGRSRPPVVATNVGRAVSRNSISTPGSDSSRLPA